MNMNSINELPPEILVNIFSRYMETEGPLLFLKNVSPVCKLWRDLCSTSSLWDEFYWERDLENLLKLGERGFLAFTRTLDLSSGRTYFYQKILPEHFLKLIQFCHNLKALDISYNLLGTKAVMQSIARNCPRLEKFVMYSMSCEYSCENENAVCPHIISTRILEPILKVCGQALKHLELQCHFTGGAGLISKIAECCSSLQEFHFRSWRQSRDDIVLYTCVNGLFPFPMDEIHRGCPEIRVLKIHGCKFEVPNAKKLEGLRKIKVFVAERCDFQGLDLFNILNKSKELEHLEVVGKIVPISYEFENPSEKVKVIHIKSPNISLGPLVEAVRKCRRSLKKLHINSSHRGEYPNIIRALMRDNPHSVVKPDYTSIIRAFLEDNQYPVIEHIELTSQITLSYLQELIRVCEKLEFLYFESDPSNEHLKIWWNRDEILKLLDSYS